MQISIRSRDTFQNRSECSRGSPAHPEVHPAPTVSVHRRNSVVRSLWTPQSSIEVSHPLIDAVAENRVTIGCGPIQAEQDRKGMGR